MISEEEYKKAIETVKEYEKQVAEALAKERAELLKPKKFKPGEWVCTTDCYHNGRLYSAGEVVKFKKQSDAPVDDEGFVNNFVPRNKDV